MLFTVPSCTWKNQLTVKILSLLIQIMLGVLDEVMTQPQMKQVEMINLVKLMWMKIA